MKDYSNEQFRALSLVLALLLLVPVASAVALVDINVNANSSTSVESDTGIYTNSDSETQSTSNVELKVNTSGVAVISSTQVNSDADLEVFSKNVVTENNNIAKVEISSEDDDAPQVVVVYKHHGKLFGFIPVTIESRTVVETGTDSNVVVKSNLPWWSFLVAKENYAKAELESQIRNNLVVRENIKVDASASAKARVAEAVITEIQTHASSRAMISTY